MGCAIWLVHDDNFDLGQVSDVDRTSVRMCNQLPFRGPKARVG